jgi:hypothetical protein
MGRRHTDKKPAGCLRIEDQSTDHIVDSVEPDFRSVIEVRAVSFQATEADPGLGVAARTG